MPNEFAARLETAVDAKDQALAQVRSSLATAVALAEAQETTIALGTASDEARAEIGRPRRSAQPSRWW